MEMGGDADRGRNRTPVSCVKALDRRRRAGYD